MKKPKKKNNKKKVFKGFTLVELLAVITILGILLIIAIPTVINITSSAQKKALVEMANLAVQAAEKQYLKDMEEHGDDLAGYPETISIYYDINKDLKMGNDKMNGVVGYVMRGDGKYYSFSILIITNDYYIEKKYDEGYDDPSERDVTIDDVEPANNSYITFLSSYDETLSLKKIVANYQARDNSNCFYEDWDLFDGTTFKLIAHSEGDKTIVSDEDAASRCTRYTRDEIIEYLFAHIDELREE